jgi:hypothetical protein
MVGPSRLEDEFADRLGLRVGKDGTRTLVIPRSLGISIFVLCMAVFICAVDIGIILLALSPGGSGIEGEHVLWMEVFSAFCLLFLLLGLYATFHRTLIVWNEAGIRVRTRFFFIRSAGLRRDWADIQDIGLYAIYCRSLPTLTLPRFSGWGKAEGEALMAILRERWGGRPGAEELPERVTLSFVLEKRERTAASAFLLVVAALGFLVCALAFYRGGLWDGWLSILGLIRGQGRSDPALLVVPPLFLAVFCVLPLIVALRLAVKPLRLPDPVAFVFDNRIARMLVCSGAWASPDPLEAAALAGYDYGEIRGFGTRRYSTYMPDSDRRNQERYTYLVELKLANGAAWVLEEHSEEGEAQARVRELSRTVRLDADRPEPSASAPRPLPAALLERGSAGERIFAWRDKSPFGASFALLFLALACAAIALYVGGKGFVPGQVFFWAFAAIALGLSIRLMALSFKNLSRAYALWLRRTEVRYGSVPIRLLDTKAGLEELESAFAASKSWPRGSIRRIATMYGEDTMKKSVRCIEIGGEGEDTGHKPNDRDSILSIRGLSLGEAVDFEHILGQEIIG